jgi:hypothetical protein
MDQVVWWLDFRVTNEELKAMHTKDYSNSL